MPGEVGELIVRGAHVMQGYWSNPEATAEKLRPGRWPWERVLATGDLFRPDEEGYLYFVGRTRRHHQVARREGRPAGDRGGAARRPGVREAAVVGVPDQLLGEAVHAHVAPHSGRGARPGAAAPYCAERLEDYMVPKRIVVHDELPRTGNGKLDRATLREH